MLPSRDECLEITKKSNCFYLQKYSIENCEVEIYNYRLASINDFLKLDALELRGITFIKDKNKWIRFPLLRKFFNYSECKGWMPEDFKNKRILKVQDKVDGSIISFIKFPSGKILAKSKMSFESDQAKLAQKIYDNDFSIRNFVNDCLSKDLHPIFELVSPKNTVILEYPKTELILLQIRDNNGNYLNTSFINILKAKEYTKEYYNIDKLLEHKKNDKGYEGFVVTYDDKMVKIKLDWYVERHRIISPDNLRENFIIETILNKNIDDILSMLPEGYKKDFIKYIYTAIARIYSKYVSDVLEEIKTFKMIYNSNKKEYALKHKNDKLFSIVMKLINSNDVEKDSEFLIKNYILKRTNTLNKAKDFLKEIDEKTI